MPIGVPVSAAITHRLNSAGLRPTRQRILLGHLLFGSDEHRHVTAEQLLRECKEAKVHISLATIYNTLHQFTKAGLLRELVVESGRVYFDTYTEHHHHFYCEKTGLLSDIPKNQIQLMGLPIPPEGMQLMHVDVIVRVAPMAQSPSA
jgi:Fur family transcriptional regulator, iron response regulator